MGRSANDQARYRIRCSATWKLTGVADKNFTYQEVGRKPLCGENAVTVVAAKRVYQKTVRTPEQLAELRAIRDKYQAEKPSLKQAIAESGAEAIPLAEMIQIHEVFAMLKRVREQSGVSLAELAQKCGIDSATLSKLETGKQNNPTLGTISRVSNALGKRVRCVIEDAVTVG